MQARHMEVLSDLRGCQANILVFALRVPLTPKFAYRRLCLIRAGIAMGYDIVRRAGRRVYHLGGN